MSQEWQSWQVRFTEVVAILMLAIPAMGYAQAYGPVFPALDANGVNVSNGSFVYSNMDVAIGQPGAGGLAYTRYYQSAPNTGWTHNQNGFLTYNGTTCSVVIGTFVETFTSTGVGCNGTFTSDQQRGATLFYSTSTGVYTYGAADGTTARFFVITGGKYFLNMTGPVAYLFDVTHPDGEVDTYGYEYSTPICYPDPEWCYITYQYARLSAVSNNLGYRLYFLYSSPPESNVQPYKVIGINSVIESCSASCAYPWPSATYTYDGSGYPATAVNALGQTTTYSYSSSSLTSIQFPGGIVNAINVAYSYSAPGYRVTSFNRGFGAWTYGYSDSGTDRTTTVTSPDSKTRVHVSEISSGRIKRYENELYQSTNYAYDSAKRNTRVTQPQGNYTEFTYDSRGNVVQTRSVSKTAGTPADIVTSAAFPSTCVYTKTCNKPTSTTDARGFRTDYTYDNTNGALTKITYPALSGAAPIGSGAQPEVRNAYSQYQARYQSTPGVWVNGTAVWRLSSTSTCAASGAPGCIGTSGETVTSLGYLGSSSPNNALPITVTRAAGDASLSATTSLAYNNWGDVSTSDGPLAGSADTTRYYYDALRRRIGVVGPDPDGGGALQYRANRISYNAAGLPTAMEQGTAVSQGDSAITGANMSVLAKTDLVYDSYGRKVQAREWNVGGGTVAALTEFNYDTRGRPMCTAVRMNPATLNYGPSNACSPGTAGSLGPDRITATLYDDADRLSQVISAYGTGLQQATASYTYTANGLVATFTDARGYKTGYNYDGLDRPSQQLYPDPTSTNVWSTTDYEQLGYDASGMVNSLRRRSGDVFWFSYDNAGHLTLRDAPGSQPDEYFGYDLLGRMTTQSRAGSTTTTAYNALSQVTSQASSTLGTVSYLYDGAGRRSRLTYPDGFYVSYAYNLADEMTSISEYAATTLATYAYDNLGRRTSLARANGVATNYTFDAMSNLASLATDATGSTYDNTYSFSYNPAQQLVSRTRTNSVYDWTLPSSYSQGYAANGLNQYTAALGVTPSYDARGNLTGDGTKTYSYDYDNRISSASGGVTADYDPAGRLFQIAGGSTTRFLYDGHRLIGELNASGSMLRRYVHGPGSDEPVVWYEGSGTGDRRWLVPDERGSIVAVTDGSGNVIQVNRYGEYGEQPGSGNLGRFQYTGQTWIAELGLYHYKARQYHPGLGRFAQTDPIGYAGGLNLYAYVSNDPINLVDPLGLADCEGEGHYNDKGDWELPECTVNGSRQGGVGGSGSGAGSGRYPNYPGQADMAAAFMADCGYDPASTGPYTGRCAPQTQKPSRSDMMATSRGEPTPETEDENAKDIAKCNQLPDPGARSRCFESAGKRDFGRRWDKPVPPLILWNQTWWSGPDPRVLGVGVAVMGCLIVEPCGAIGVGAGAVGGFGVLATQ